MMCVEFTLPEEVARPRTSSSPSAAAGGARASALTQSPTREGAVGAESSASAETECKAALDTSDIEGEEGGDGEDRSKKRARIA